MSALSSSSWRVRASGGCPSGDGGGERGPFGNGEAEREGEGEGDGGGGEAEREGEGAAGPDSSYWNSRGANS